MSLFDPNKYGNPRKKSVVIREESILSSRVEPNDPLEQYTNDQNSEQRVDDQLLTVQQFFAATDGKCKYVDEPSSACVSTVKQEVSLRIIKSISDTTLECREIRNYRPRTSESVRLDGATTGSDQIEIPEETVSPQGLRRADFESSFRSCRVTSTPIKRPSCSLPRGNRLGSLGDIEADITTLDSSTSAAILAGMSTQDLRLEQLRKKSMTKIATRNKDRGKQRQRRDTTSLQDLKLARTIVNSERPQDSKRPWAVEDPIVRKAETVHEDARWQIVGIPLKKTQNKKWATLDEMRAEKSEAQSNGWGSAPSDNPSEATKSSHAADKQFGKLLMRRHATDDHERDHPLVDFEGNMLPPPEDWELRERYNNNNTMYKKQFKHWLDLQTVECDQEVSTTRFNNGNGVVAIPSNILNNTEWHADGVSVVKIQQQVDFSNATQRYGYTSDGAELADMVRFARPLSQYDLEDWGKLDSKDDNNVRYKDETAEILVHNWIKHRINSGEAGPDASVLTKNDTRPVVLWDVCGNIVSSGAGDNHDMGDVVDTSSFSKPTLNIYIRPATLVDIPELTRLYNWYTVNSARTTEASRVPEAEMRSRVEGCAETQLPFIVACSKNTKGARILPHNALEGQRYSASVSLLHSNGLVSEQTEATQGLARAENIVGFASLVDLTASDWVEYISSELEIYVDARYKRLGIGKALMDRMLWITDRGYKRTMDCDFHCANEVRHFYSQGGARDIHKLIIMLRKHSEPVKTTFSNVKPKIIPMKTRYRMVPVHEEDEYEAWSKLWLKNYGFEVEGHLKKVAAKNGRYLDIVYLTRETAWAPAEGEIPAPRIRNAAEGENEQI